MNLQDTYIDIVEIGSGGGGTVFKAYHVRMKKYVVLKKIHDGIRNSVDIRGELDILKNLRHSYLPTVLDFIEDDGSIYTVMDYISGESFESLLIKKVHFQQTQVVKYAQQLGEVLVYLHGQTPPIVHGDIKPANIILTSEDNICLIDFNISQVKNGSVGLNMGYTPGYAAPEQIKMVQEVKLYCKKYNSTAGLNLGGRTEILQQDKGTVLLETAPDKTVLLEPDSVDIAGVSALPLSELPCRIDERSDIYSVGATLYALLSEVTPNADYAEILLVEKVRNECSKGLAYVINKCMEYEPEKRFQSAEQFLKTVLGIAKMDKRYRRLVFRQDLTVLFCIMGIAGCITLAASGRERMREEQVAGYHVLTSDMEELRFQDGNDAEFEEIYNEAKSMFPSYAEAYYQKALYLYEKRLYPEMIDFILEEALKNDREFSREEKGNFYYLLANGCMENEDLAGAISYFRTAVQYNPYDNSGCIDYAIALARAGLLTEAAEVLSSVPETGGMNDKVLLAQGEISGRQGKIAEADAYFRQCVSETEDDYVLLRAYIMWGKLHDSSQPSLDSLTQRADVLEEGVEAVKQDYKPIVLEQLAQTYIDLGGLTGDREQYVLAIEKLKQITDLGWDTYITHSNIGILYEQIGEYDFARQEFFEMISIYGEDYRTYKRLAFLEIDIQEAKSNSDREYSTFLEYYTIAKELFVQSGVQADSDMEMQLLEQAYGQLQAGNWL